MIEVLNDLKTLIEEQVCKLIILPQPPEEEVMKESVNPSIFIGYIPINPEAGVTPPLIPSIIIGLDDGSIDNSEGNLSIQITYCTYSDSNDMEGYSNLLRLFDLTMKALNSDGVLKKGTIQKPFKFGHYKEQPWPYWYGYFNFEINIPFLESKEGYDEYL